MFSFLTDLKDSNLFTLMLNKYKLSKKDVAPFLPEPHQGIEELERILRNSKEKEFGQLMKKLDRTYASEVKKKARLSQKVLHNIHSRRHTQR